MWTTPSIDQNKNPKGLWCGEKLELHAMRINLISTLLTHSSLCNISYLKIKLKFKLARICRRGNKGWKQNFSLFFPFSWLSSTWFLMFHAIIFLFYKMISYQSGVHVRLNSSTRRSCFYHFQFSKSWKPWTQSRWESSTTFESLKRLSFEFFLFWKKKEKKNKFTKWFELHSRSPIKPCHDVDLAWTFCRMSFANKQQREWDYRLQSETISKTIWAWKLKKKIKQGKKGFEKISWLK